MPAMTIARFNGRRLTTRPLAGDDFQLVCVLTGAFRLISLICTIPVWVRIFRVRLSGTEMYAGDQPFWCRKDDADLLAVYYSSPEEQQEWLDSSFDDETRHQFRSMVIPFSLYLIVSLLYNILDIVHSLAVWNAASIGTPVEPRGRQSALVSMIWIKLTIMNLLLCTVLGSGVFLTYSGRKYNYGCSSLNNEAVETYESSIWYGLFSASMAVYAVELLISPCALMNQAGHAIALRSKEVSLFKKGQLGEGTCAQCIGCCIQCLRCMSCYQKGGGNIKANSDLKDAAIAFMNFMNSEENFDIVMSDIYVAFKLLNRKHRELRYKLSKQAKMDNEQTNAELGDCEVSGGQQDTNNSNTSAPTKAVHFSVNYANILDRRVLSDTDANDMYLLRQGALYSQYAHGVYKEYPRALLDAGLLDGGWDGMYMPWKPGDRHSLLSTFRLTEFGFHSTALIYANFTNKVMATPYCLLLDETERTLVVVVRGSVTLEDLVTDLQWSSIELDRVGDTVGFDGSGKFAHRGMLTNSKWIYNDIHKRRIVSDVLRDDESNPYRGYNLVITGHSLGGGCAALLAIMFKPMYPNLKCYAFCIPGCTVSMNLATECDDFITSFVVGNDIIPRIRGENVETLRYEFLEMLARIKVSKKVAFTDSRYPCRNKDLEVRNQRILYARNEIPNTEYYQKLKAFKENRQRFFNQLHPVETRLNIPGRVIHLIHIGDDSKNRYLPYYKSRTFREIHLGLDSMKDHSLQNLQTILRSVVCEYENTSETASNDDEDDISAQSENSFGGDISEEPWFVVFSFPQGVLASLIPTLLAIAAVCLSISGNNLCSLFERRVTNGTSYKNTTTTADQDEDHEVIVGVSYGLYFYGVEYVDEAYDIMYTTQCKPYPSEVDNDAYVKTARAFSAIALTLGIPVTFLLCLTSCMKLGNHMTHLLSSLMMLIAICQAMIFVFIGSGRCVDNPNPVDSTSLEVQIVWATCALHNGSKIVIVAGVLWTLAAVTLCFSCRLALVEVQIRYAFSSLTTRK